MASSTSKSAFIYRPAKLTVPIEKHEQNLRLVVTIFVANADNTKMQYGDPHYGVCVIGSLVSHSPIKHESTNDVISGWLSVRG